MRRLPFALAALASILPIVACLQQTDNADESGADIDDSTKTACNFAFQEVTQPAAQKVTHSSAAGVADGEALLFGDFTGDGKADFLVASTTNQVQLWQGDGAGHFAAKGSTTIPTDTGPLAGRQLTALATVATGDFDGDKKNDAVVIVTSVATPAAGAAIDPTTSYGTLVVLYGKASAPTVTAAVADAGTPTADDAGTATDDAGAATADAGAPPAPAVDAFDVVAQTKTSNITSSFYHLVADLDGDGHDDLVYTGATGESFTFGAKDRMLVPSDTHWTSTATRSLAYVTPKSGTAAASILIVGGGKAATVTFDATRKATLTESAAPAIAAGASRIGTDLDQDHSPEVTILADTLSITPIPATHGKAVSFQTPPGHLIGALDLDGNKSTELLATSAGMLVAACGYTATTTAIAVVGLPVPYPTNGFVAGQADLDGDGHPDLVTMTNDGVLRAFRFNGRNATPPTLTIFNVAGAAADAGTDAAVHVDSGADAATAAKDSGVADASTSTTTDSGATSSPGYDAGTHGTTSAPPASETQPPPQEGSGRLSNAPSSYPSSSSSEPDPSGQKTAPITDAPAATSDNSGCAAAPAGRAPLGFPALILGALVLLGARRRRR